MKNDYELMIVSAVRYALNRHSYMVGVTQDYIKNNWTNLTSIHWCILRDIREHIQDNMIGVKDVESLYKSDYDLLSWRNTYNYLINLEETKLTDNWSYLRTTI